MNMNERKRVWGKKRGKIKEQGRKNNTPFAIETLYSTIAKEPPEDGKG